MSKLPDSFVPDRKFKEYPTEIGSQKFSPDNIELFKLEKTHKVKQFYTKKFEELSKEYESLISEIIINEMIYSSKHNFEPVIGQSYYLYKKSDHNFLSMISPDEWKTDSEFVGKFQLLSDGRWISLK